ncbi:phosphoglycerate kinase [Sarracenia purpurea var. burkii]
MSQLLNLTQGTLFICTSNFYSFPSSSLKLLRPKPSPHTENYASLPKHRGNRFSVKELDTFPHIQNLREFPKEELPGKVVMVRFDSIILLREEWGSQSSSVSSALSTIKYLYNAGAKVILVSNWSVKNSLELVAEESVAGNNYSCF